MQNPLFESVNTLLEQVLPVLGLHGGSVELVDISTDNVVFLRFQGACVGCKAADMTLEYGLKEFLMMQLEEITDVQAVNNEPISHDAPKNPLQWSN